MTRATVLETVPGSEGASHRAQVGRRRGGVAGLPDDAKVLVISPVMWDANGRPVEVNDMAADAASYEFDL
jgi:hypothetical protein